MDVYTLSTVFAVFLVMLYSIMVLYMQLRKEKNAHLKEIQRNKKSLTASKAVIKGQVSEQMFPLSVDSPFPISDMRFLGQPFDYLVINGYSEGDVKEIVFVEIKTGNSHLSAIQRSLRDCIDSGRVRWQTINIKE